MICWRLKKVVLTIVIFKYFFILSVFKDILELETNNIDSEKLFKEKPKLLSRGQRVKRFIGFKQVCTNQLKNKILYI